MEGMTLKEAFMRVKLEVSHLRVLDSPMYVNIPSKKRTKLEPSSKRGIFVQYSETSKAYRFYIPGQQKIVVKMDVKFEDGRTFRRSHGADPTMLENREREAPKGE